MKKFRIDYTYTTHGTCYIDAEDWEEAEDKLFYNEFTTEGEERGEYFINEIEEED